MNKQAKIEKVFFGFLILIIIIFAYPTYCKLHLPNEIYVHRGKRTKLQYDVPAMARIQGKTICLNEPFYVKENRIGKYKVYAKLFGKVPLKTMKVNVCPKTYVYPSGQLMGIYIETKGLLVISTDRFVDANHISRSPSQKKLYPGDYIQAMNGCPVDSKSNFLAKVNDHKNRPMILSVLRKNKSIRVRITPAFSRKDGKYKIGAWIRDNTQGIGTMTYITKGHFAGLGHGIVDMDTRTLMKIQGGFLVAPTINALHKGSCGRPGEVVGSIDYVHGQVVGVISKNKISGIYGKTSLSTKEKPYTVAFPHEIRLGKAYIFSGISGKIEKYEIRVNKICKNTDKNLKDLEIQVTDARLLAKTNGILQGMSGSPIVQNHQFIGAVTHVFIQDSKRGYGIFAERMMNEEY